MVGGLTKYTELLPNANPSKTELETVLQEITTAIQNSVKAAGEAERATKELSDVRDKALGTARRMRDFLYASFGKLDPRLVEFGLDTYKARKSSKNGDDSTTSTPET
jgi:hypothetical protein